MGMVLSVCKTTPAKIYPKYPEHADTLTPVLQRILQEQGHCSPAYPISELAARLITKISDSASREVAIDYYINLASKNESVPLLDCALYLSQHTGLIILPKRASLKILARLELQGSEFLLRLNGLCEQKHLFLKAAHLDALASSLTQQKQLPEFSIQVLDNYLSSTTINYKTALQQLRATHGPELDLLAKKNMKLHHASAHALEIKIRVMQIMAQLDLSCKKESKEFLHEIVSFMIEFHDYEQVDCGIFSSVEEATADKVLSWLNKALQLEAYPMLSMLCKCLANKIIVLATTMVFGVQQTIDLSELYLLLEQHAIQQGHFIAHSSNIELNAWINKVMLLVGIADKTPAAFVSVVSAQAENQKINTLKLVQKALNVEHLLIEIFFTSSHFQPYFANIPSNSVEQAQAFFIILAPHVGMPVELLAKKYSELVAQFIAFIAQCRECYVLMGAGEFEAWYREASQQIDIVPMFDELFFSSLDGEIAFAQSQYAALNGVIERLVSYKVPINSLVERFVPLTDAHNVSMLKSFYEQLVPEQKRQLIAELVLGVVLQAGFIYAQQKEYGYSLISTNKMSTASARFFPMVDLTAATQDTTECSEAGILNN